MTERQKKLVRDYGPRFLERSKRIFDEFLYLPADAISILTDEEWKDCANAIDKVTDELYIVEEIVCERMKEAGVELE